MSSDEQSRRDEGEFEQALSRSLRRVDAPGDLMARVMAQVQQAASSKQETESVKRWFSLGSRWNFGWKPAWGAMAAMLVACVLTGHVVREHRIEAQERAREQASREFDVSVQITDKAIDHAREQLRRAGVAIEEDGQ